MLVNDIATIKEYVPINADMSIGTLKPAIRSAESNYIKPAISPALYASLDAAVQANSLTGTQQSLLDAILPCLCNFAVLHYVSGPGYMQITNGSMKIINDTEYRAASKWSVDNLKELLSNEAWKALDNLIQFLEENESDYPDWIGSKSYTRNNDCFIAFVDDFQDVYDIKGSRRTFLSLRNYLVLFQRNTLRKTIGDAFYNEMLSQFANNTLTADNQALIPDIRTAMAYYAIRSALISQVLTIDENGVSNVGQKAVRDSNVEITTATDTQRSVLLQECLDQSNAALISLKSTLETNPTLYPTYASSTAYIGTGTTGIKQDNTSTIVYL